MRLLRLVCLCGLLSTLLAAPAGATQSFDQLCLDILGTLQSFYPVHATEMGIHEHDSLLADYSSRSVNDMIRKLEKYEKALYAFRDVDFDRHQRLNYKLIKSNVDVALLDLKQIAWYKKSPQLYVDEAINGVYFLTLSGNAALEERQAAIVARMRAVPALLHTAQVNITRPPLVWVETAQESLESGQEFYREVAAELMNDSPEQADEILSVSTKAREAMNDFSTWLSRIKTGPDSSFAIGKTNFDYLLSNEYFLPFNSDSLLAIGQALLDQAQTAYHDYQADMLARPAEAADSVYVPACVSVEDILDYYNWETEQLRIYSEQSQFITVPEQIADVSVIETPTFLRNVIGGIAYQAAGPFDSTQQGYFYVRPLPRDMDRQQLEARFHYIHRRGFRGSAVHEAYPGHHLQMQLAGLNPDPVRKWQSNTMMIEGWALYCEEAVYEHGLYGKEDPTQWLAVLGGIRFRAARIVADVKLHTGQFTYQQCVDWMNQVLETDSESGREYIGKEVRRYTMTPTYQMSYLMGKREIVRLRDAVKARDGANFSLKAFHDALLAEGSVPPALMWEVLGVTP